MPRARASLARPPSGPLGPVVRSIVRIAMRFKGLINVADLTFTVRELGSGHGSGGLKWVLWFQRHGQRARACSLSRHRGPLW